MNRLRALLSDPLLRHSVLLMAAAQLGNVANLAFQILMNRRLSDAEYGVLTAMVTLMAMVILPLDALRTTLAHRTALWIKEDRGGDVRALCVLWSRRTLATWGVLFAALLIGGSWVGASLRLSNPWPLWMTGVGLMGIMLLPVMTGVLQGMQRFTVFAWATQSPSFLRFILGVGLVIWIPRAWTGIAAQAAGFIAAAVCATVWARAGWRGLQASGKPIESSDAYFFKSLSILSAFAVLMLVDVLLVKAWFDVDLAGRYSRAATIARAIVYLPMPVAMALFPKVVSRGERTREGRRMLAQALAGVAGLLAVSAATAWLLASLLWRIFTGSEPSLEELHLLRGLVLALAPLALAHLLLNFELAQHRFRTCVIAVVGVVVYMVGVFIWHPTPLAVAGWLGGVSLAVFIGLALAQWRGTAQAISDTPAT